jgi:hypothetical protein
MREQQPQEGGGSQTCAIVNPFLGLGHQSRSNATFRKIKSGKARDTDAVGRIVVPQQDDSSRPQDGSRVVVNLV